MAVQQAVAGSEPEQVAGELVAGAWQAAGRRTRQARWQVRTRQQAEIAVT